LLWLIAVVALAAGGCASMNLPMPGDASAPVGTPPWWRAHKKKAVFEGPGVGYAVAGTPGHFDQQGRPMTAKVAKVVPTKDGDGGLLGDADFKKTVSGFKEQVGLGPDQTQAKLDYAAGEDLFRHEKYAEAAARFKKAADNWPDSQLEQDAMFQMGESYFFAEKYPTASNSYEKLIRKYPNSGHLDKIIARQFSIARYWDQYHNYNPDWVLTPNLFSKTRPLFDTIGRSMKTYENIRINDPTGPLADDAIMATANSYFLRGRFNEADEQYTLLRKDYPRSDHQYEAHLLGLRCKLQKYQGPDYDGAPLEEAKLLVKQLKQQFSGRLDAEQRDQLAKVDAELRREVATRDYMMAQHFDNTEQYGSARFYYGQVVRDHPHTPFAQQANERLMALQGLPDRPQSSLDPILDLLPENSERSAIANVPMRDGANDIQVAEAPKEGDADGGKTIRR
jgi:TolA-binding protein